MLPVLLDADPAIVVPWGAITGLIGSLFGLIGLIAAYAYRGDLKSVSIKADTAIEQAKKAISLHDALKTSVAEERTERIRLEGKLAVMQADHDAREDMRERLVTRNGFEERTDRQDQFLERITEVVSAIGKKTGSIQSMPAVQARYAPPVPRRDDTVPPDPLPQLPPMRPRQPSRGKYGGGE